MLPKTMNNGVEGSVQLACCKMKLQEIHLTLLKILASKEFVLEENYVIINNMKHSS